MLFYTLDINTGNPLTSGLIKSSSNCVMRDLEEIDGYVLIIVSDSGNGANFLSFIDRTTSNVVKEYIQTDIDISSGYTRTINGENILFMGATISNIYRFIRSKTNDLNRFSFLTQRATIFTNITTSFMIEDPPSPLPALTLETRNVIIEDQTTLARAIETTTEHGNEYFADLYSNTIIEGLIY